MSQKSKERHVERVERASASPVNESMARLRELFPGAMAEGKIDFARLRELLGEDVDERPERYSFTWAGKRDAIRLVQIPSRATLVPVPNESVNFDSTGNIFVEGDNLEVLKLLYKPYAGRVKMVYIDPPYNTGNDFVYPDNFADPLGAYLKSIGQKDANGNLLTSNPDTSGRYHSAWLSMMYPRLFIARQLLRPDGVIFVSIDDHELYNLRNVMNEVFGEECFKNCIIFKRGIKNVQAQFETVDALTVGHEYVVMYARDPAARFKHLHISLDEAKEGGWNNHWRGTDRPTMRYELFGKKPKTGQWRWSKRRSLQAIENYKRMVKELGVRHGEPSQEQIDGWYRKQTEQNGEEIDLLRLSSSDKPEHYVAPSETKLGSDLWADISPRGTPELKALFGQALFDNPKPVGLIQRMLDFVTDSDKEDMVVDFFAGSCSTAEAVLRQNAADGGNRRFIMVQLPEPTPEGSTARKAGYKTIADIGKERLRRVIKELKEEENGARAGQKLDAGFRTFKLDESNYRSWRGVESRDGEKYAETMEMFTDPLVPGWKPLNLIYEVAIKEGYGLRSIVAELKHVRENTVYQVTNPEKSQSFRICLDDRLKALTVKALSLAKDDVFICRDIALTDEQAANLALQCQLKTI